MENVNQMNIDEFLGTLIEQQPLQKRAKTPKPATSNVTSETRKESNKKTDKQSLQLLVIGTLRGKELTAREVDVEMHKKGFLPYPARSIIQPRITELVEDGKLTVTGKKWDEETERNVAAYKVV